MTHPLSEKCKTYTEVHSCQSKKKIVEMLQMTKVRILTVSQNDEIHAKILTYLTHFS